MNASKSTYDQDATNYVRRAKRRRDNFCDNLPAASDFLAPLSDTFTSWWQDYPTVDFDKWLRAPKKYPPVAHQCSKCHKTFWNERDARAHEFGLTGNSGTWRFPHFVWINLPCGATDDILQQDPERYYPTTENDPFRSNRDHVPVQVETIEWMNEQKTDPYFLEQPPQFQMIQKERWNKFIKYYQEMNSKVDPIILADRERDWLSRHCRQSQRNAYRHCAALLPDKLCPLKKFLDATIPAGKESGLILRSSFDFKNNQMIIIQGFTRDSPLANGELQVGDSIVRVNNGCVNCSSASALSHSLDVMNVDTERKLVLVRYRL